MVRENSAFHRRPNARPTANDDSSVVQRLVSYRDSVDRDPEYFVGILREQYRVINRRKIILQLTEDQQPNPPVILQMSDRSLSQVPK